MKIILKNCNNVDYGEVKLVEKHLNIKYAINGTGKSTISKALSSLINEKLSDLTPFKYYEEKESDRILNKHNPIVEIYKNDEAPFKGFVKENSPIQSVRVFDEDYVERYTFVGDDVVQNSFEIYVKTRNYEKKMEEIESLIKGIKDFFNSNSDLDDIIARFNLFLTKIVKPGKKIPISTTAPLSKALNDGNKTINVPNDLKGYQSFITSKVGGKWLQWQQVGNEYLDWGNKNAHCPYCSKDIEDTHKPVIKRLSEEYSSSYLTDLEKVLEAFESIKVFFVDSIKDKIDQLGSSPVGFTSNETDLISGICVRIEALGKRLENAKNIGFESLKDVDDIIAMLNDNFIDLDVYPELKSPKTEAIVNELNISLQKTLEKAKELKIAVDGQNQIIHETIRKNEDGINNFLAKAGYQYVVEIEEDVKTKKYRMLLKCRNRAICVTNIKKHLSYGERNAFALALFMYDVLREGPDLVILDDPISSFDKHKKYAIMDMLFCNEDITLRGMTVLLLTHDFEPVSDVLKIHSKAFTWKSDEDGHGQFVKVTFLRNEVDMDSNETLLIEKNVLDCHVKNYIRVLKDNCRSADNLVSKLIYLRRLKEIEGEKKDVWDILSCFFHKDILNPQKFDGQLKKYVEIDAADITSAENIISREIQETFVYSEEYPKFWNIKNMIDIFNHCDKGYERLQIYRCLSNIVDEEESDMNDAIFAKFINETYHSEMDYIFQLNPREFEIIPYYILNRCNNKVQEYEKYLLKRGGI